MKIDNLSDEEKRVLIAEFCGWKVGVKVTDRGWADDCLHLVSPDGVVMYSWAQYVKNPSFACALPDYLNSLDAMHEAEKMLEKDVNLEGVYWNIHLPDVVGLEGDEKNGHWCAYKAIGTATARDRADALLLTLPESQNVERTVG